jgi:hypothetical protein
MDASGQTYFAPEDEIPVEDRDRLAEQEALDNLKRIAARVRALEILEERSSTP